MNVLKATGQTVTLMEIMPLMVMGPELMTTLQYCEFCKNKTLGMRELSQILAFSGLKNGQNRKCKRKCKNWPYLQWYHVTFGCLAMAADIFQFQIGHCACWKGQQTWPHVWKKSKNHKDYKTGIHVFKILNINCIFFSLVRNTKTQLAA